ncbi:MAG: MATE family efflux transporter [Bacteroidia bacterium]
MLVLSIGISYGLTPIVAEYNAQKNHFGIVAHLRHAIVLNLIVAALLFLVLFFSSGILRFTDKPADVIELSIRFLNVIMLSMIPLSLFFTFKQFAEGMSDTKVAMYITIASNILNITLNYILVFGKLGVPAMGIMGSCWATFISRTVMGIAMPVYIWFNPRYSIYREAFRIVDLKKSHFTQQLKIGIPSGLMFVMEVAAFSVPTIFIPGSDQLAAHRISLSLAAMTYMISSGLGAAATIRTGTFLGLNDFAGVRKAGYSAVLLSLMFMSAAALCFIIFSEQLVGLFNDETAVLKVASPLLIIAAAFQLFDGTQVTMQGALRGIQDTIIPGIIAFAAYWIVGLPLSWLLCTKAELGVIGVWYGFVIGLGIAASGFFLRFRHLSRKNNALN